MGWRGKQPHTQLVREVLVQSQLAELLWTDPWPEERSWCTCADLDFKKNAGRGMILQTFPLNSHMQGKHHHQTSTRPSYEV